MTQESRENLTRPGRNQARCPGVKPSTPGNPIHNPLNIDPHYYSANIARGGFAPIGMCAGCKAQLAAHITAQQRLAQTGNLNQLGVPSNVRIIPDQTDCGICLDDFDRGSTISALHCGHIFHTACILGWIAQQKGDVKLRRDRQQGKAPFCPTCRGPICDPLNHDRDRFYSYIFNR